MFLEQDCMYDGCIAYFYPRGTWLESYPYYTLPCSLLKSDKKINPVATKESCITSTQGQDIFDSLLRPLNKKCLWLKLCLLRWKSIVITLVKLGGRSCGRLNVEYRWHPKNLPITCFPKSLNLNLTLNLTLSLVGKYKWFFVN